MLKFFRRIRKGLLGSGQVNKYILYTIGEIALVVIGILIALQINNWNEGRKARILEMEILNDLKLNLENNVSLISGRVEYFHNGLSSSRIILNIMDQKLPYHDSLSVHFSRATRGYGGADVISYVGYETLKNYGFKLITNKSLRDEIVYLFENTYRALISLDETFKLQNTYHIEVKGDLLYHDKRHSLVPFDFIKLINSERYYASVADHYNNYSWMKEETIGGLAETRRVLQLVTKELEMRK